MSFRDNILETIHKSPQGVEAEEPSPFDDELEDFVQKEETEPAKEEVIETKQEVVDTPPPAVVETPSTPAEDPRFSEWQAKLDMVMNQNQALLNRLVDRSSQVNQAPQEQIDTGAVGGDPYFATRDDIRNVLAPLTQRLEQTQAQVQSLRANTIAEDFQKTERQFREKYGEDFDKYVPPALRSAAIQGATKQAMAGQLESVNWADKFEYEYRVRHYEDLVAEKKAAAQREQTLAKQQEELKKVTAMPRGTTSHQAPAAPKRKEGESRSDAFRNTVKSLLKGLAQ